MEYAEFQNKCKSCTYAHNASFVSLLTYVICQDRLCSNELQVSDVSHTNQYACFVALEPNTQLGIKVMCAIALSDFFAEAYVD